MFSSCLRVRKRKRVAFADTDNSEFPSPLNRRCLGEPDVEVVVGGTLFKHYSFILCYASEYFDTMLSSGMQESQNKKIEFPDKDPAEWKLVYPFLEPRSLSTADLVSITKENAKAILPWFHEFGMTRLLHESDEQLCSSLQVFSKGFHESVYHSLEARKGTLLEIVEWAELADTYSLSRTRAAMRGELQIAAATCPELMTKGALTRMATFWSKDHDIDLWKAVKAELPQCVTDGNDDDTLRSNPLFLDFLAQSFKLAALKKDQLRTHGGIAGNADSDGEIPERLASRQSVLAGMGRVRNFRQQLNEARVEMDEIRRNGAAHRRMVRRRQAAVRVAELRDRARPALDQVDLQPLGFRIHDNLDDRPT